MSPSHAAPMPYIPASDWPYEREGAPAALEFLRCFCNTVNPENGAERFATADSLDHWLAEQGRAAMAVGERDLTRLRALRKGVRQLRAGEPAPGLLLEVLDSVPLSLGFAASADRGRLVLTSSGSPVDQLIAELTDILLGAQHEGTLKRLKVCCNDHCGWMFYDRSNNASGKWCTMQACGQRHKAKAYRRRVAAASDPHADTAVSQHP